MTPNAPHYPPGISPKPKPETPEQEAAIIRKAYADARMHVRNYKKAVAELGFQRQVIAAQVAKIKGSLDQLAKLDGQLATEEAKLDGQSKTLDDNLAELKKIVDSLDAKAG